MRADPKSNWAIHVFHVKELVDLVAPDMELRPGLLARNLEGHGLVQLRVAGHPHRAEVGPPAQVISAIRLDMLPATSPPSATAQAVAAQARVWARRTGRAKRVQRSHWSRAWEVGLGADSAFIKQSASCLRTVAAQDWVDQHTLVPSSAGNPRTRSLG